MMPSAYNKKNHRLELNVIFGRFIKEIKELDPLYFHKFYEKMDKRGENDIIILFPYLLSDAMGCHLPLNTMRALALGNQYLTASVLGQDRIMDNQRHLIQEEDIVMVMLASNFLYYKGIKEYQRVFPAHSRFWLFFEKYFAEYSRSTLWEKQEHWGKLKDYTETDLKYLGQKFSPVKISGAGMCLLNNRKEWIPLLSELLEQYHIGYQLADDVSDWREDLRDRNYTYILTKMHKAASATTLCEQEIYDHPLARPIVKEVLEKSTFHYLKAKDIARQLPCQQLCTILDTLIEKNEKTLIDLKISLPKSIDLSESHLDIDTTLRANEVHYFENNGSHFVFDVNRHLTFNIDQPAYEMLKLTNSTKDWTLRSISQGTTTSPSNDVANIIKEFRQAGVIRAVNQDAEPISKIEEFHNSLGQRKYESIVGIDIQISTRSPHRQLMTSDTAKKAVDLLFHRSGYYKGELTVFLCCAVLENDEANVIQKVIEYSKQLGTRLKRTIHFILNIPLMDTNIDLVSQYLRTDVLSSINFSSDCEDVFAFSKRADVQQVVTLIRECKKPVRITLIFNGNSKKREEATELLRTLGFKKIFLQTSDDHTKLCCSNMLDDTLLQYENNNHFYFINSLRITARAVKQNPFPFHCNAGKSYLSIASDGTIFPCPQFIGYSDHSMGNVFTNKDINQARYLKRDVESLELCRNCWARYICGGGCMFHSQLVTGSLNTPDSQWCIKYKKQVEQLISRYYKLTPEERKELNETTKFNFQFCDSL